jgi:hypothetical protein
METAQEALEETHFQVAPSLLAPARAARADLILAPEITFPTTTARKNESSIRRKKKKASEKKKRLAVQGRYPGLHRKDGGPEVPSLLIRNCMARGSAQWPQRRY